MLFKPVTSLLRTPSATSKLSPVVLTIILQDTEIQELATSDADKMEVVEITSTTTLDLLVPSEELLSKGGSAPLETGDSASEEEDEVEVVGTKAPMPPLNDPKAEVEVVATTATQPPTDKPDDGQLTTDEFQRRKVNTIAEVVFRNVDIRYKEVTKNVVRLPNGWNKKRKAKLVKEKEKKVQ